MAKNTKKRQGAQKTATASTPEGELQRHLQALGLETVAEYREWCRRQGFGGAIHKGWRERREEEKRAQKLAEEKAAATALERHLAALGMETYAAYAAWCARHGFDAEGAKSKAQLERERRVAEAELATAALTGARRRERRPEETIQALCRGEVAAQALKSPSLQRIHAAFEAVGGQTRVRNALRDLLLVAQRRADLFGPEPVIPHIGPQEGNTYLHALRALAQHCADWRRAPEDWRPDTHNAHRQFATLARHLLADYPVPAFMDAAWFAGETPEARRDQEWFKYIGSGINIRKAALPLPLTSMAAHHFLLAPRDFAIEGALRWGQLKALGGDEYLIRAVVASRLGSLQEDESFWFSVLQFLVNNPMLDTACVGPIVDYITHQKFAPRMLLGEDGIEREAGPLWPDFAMKGRTAPALLQRVEEWHRQLARETKRPPQQWNPTGIGAFELVERDEASGARVRWTVRELLTAHELNEEGKAMRHCVASYARSCAKGNNSIWSVQVADPNQEEGRRVMTLEVQNARRAIVQARGRCNKAPGDKRTGPRLSLAPRIVKLWAAQEGLTVAVPL